MAHQTQSRDTQPHFGRQMEDALRGQVGTTGTGTNEFMEQAARRLQDMSLESYRYLQDAMDLNTGAMNRLIGCRSIGELAEAQRDYLKQAIDHAFAASRRLYGIGEEMAEEMGASANATLREVADETDEQRDAGGKGSASSRRQ